MTKVEEYVNVVQEMFSLIPAYPNTPKGAHYEALHQRSIELHESMSDEEKRQIDDLLGRFYVPEDVRTIPLVD